MLWEVPGAPTTGNPAPPPPPPRRCRCCCCWASGDPPPTAAVVVVALMLGKPGAPKGGVGVGGAVERKLSPAPATAPPAPMALKEPSSNDDKLIMEGCCMCCCCCCGCGCCCCSCCT